MGLHWIDILAFIGFIVLVIVISLYASRRQETTEDYFLAGRSLTWGLIGFSLIASNISTEHFVGMAGSGFSIGLAIASYEWIAAITLVFVGLYLLPLFLKAGIYTIPEYLEYRFDHRARAVMAVYMMLAYVLVAIASVIYSGALALKTIFGLSLIKGVWLIGIVAGAYTVYGGLKAVVWTDLLQGATLLIGGLIVTILGFSALGGGELLNGLRIFFESSKDKLHMFLPANHPEMPWTIFLGGIWIPNIFYWGLNQFITQRTLGARSVEQGQKGVLLAANLKLLIPFIIVFPGIMAYQLYGSQIPQADQAYPYMIKKILPFGLRGVMLSALFGAVLSSLDSMLNSAATIFTIDLYKRYIKPKAEAHHLVGVGRLMTALFVLIGCIWAPFLDRFGSIFRYIQMVWGFVSPGIVAVFLIGLLVRKAPAISGFIALLLTGPVYGLFLYFNRGAFLNNMAFTVVTLCLVMLIFTLIAPSEPKKLPIKAEIDITPSRSAKIWGAITILVTIVLYIIFR